MGFLSKTFKPMITVLPAVLAAYIFLQLVLIFIAYNPTASMPYGFYFRSPFVLNVDVGDLVQVKNPMPGYLGVDAENLLKEVTRVTEDSKYIITGHSPDSFDSRYFGAVDRDLITAKVYPIAVSEDVRPYQSMVDLILKIDHLIKET